jgi:hypothetical protein
MMRGDDGEFQNETRHLQYKASIPSTTHQKKKKAPKSASNSDALSKASLLQDFNLSMPDS